MKTKKSDFKTQQEVGIMARDKKKGIKSKGYLMSNEFRVEVQREGWEKVSGLLRGVDFSEFLNGGDIRLDFNESRDLDVLAFFVQWALSKEASDVVVKLGSRRRELFFSGCVVDGVLMDGFSSSENSSNGRSEKTEETDVIGVAVILKYTAAFVKEKTA